MARERHRGVDHGREEHVVGVLVHRDRSSLHHLESRTAAAGMAAKERRQYGMRKARAIVRHVKRPAIATPNPAHDLHPRIVRDRTRGIEYLGVCQLWIVDGARSRQLQRELRADRTARVGSDAISRGRRARHRDREAERTFQTLGYFREWRRIGASCRRCAVLQDLPTAKGQQLCDERVRDVQVRADLDPLHIHAESVSEVRNESVLARIEADETPVDRRKQQTHAFRRRIRRPDVHAERQRVLAFELRQRHGGRARTAKGSRRLDHAVDRRLGIDDHAGVERIANEHEQIAGVPCWSRGAVGGR